MADMREESMDFISTGWLRFLPEPAFNAYGRMWVWALDGEAVAGDLDELGAEVLDVAALGGLDAVYDPAAHGDADIEPDEDPAWAIRWEEFGAQAARRGLPMRTPRDAIEFMREIGLVERVEHDGEIYWRAVVPVPLAEDLLDLDEQTRGQEAKLRWQRAFQHAEHRVTNWLVDQRTDAPTTELTIRLAEISIRLDLDLEETRQGLAVAMDAAGDISARPHPETAAPGDPIQISVDWDRFDAGRIMIVANSPDGA
jgi:hypothetical protein